VTSSPRCVFDLFTSKWITPGLVSKACLSKRAPELHFPLPFALLQIENHCSLTRGTVFPTHLRVIGFASSTSYGFHTQLTPPTWNLNFSTATSSSVDEITSRHQSLWLHHSFPRSSSPLPGVKIYSKLTRCGLPSPSFIWMEILTHKKNYSSGSMTPEKRTVRFIFCLLKLWPRNESKKPAPCAM